MEKAEISRIRGLQKEFFSTGATLSVEYRVSALKRLKKSIKEHENEICDALKTDLGKSAYESYMTEIGMIYDELSYMIKNTAKLSKKRKVATPIVQFAAESYVLPSPRGNALIMSPWNYPILLTFGPLVDALAAGNTAMVKPSAYSPATSALIGDIIKECFDE